jgi:DNA invertase Pin-like site-specific DNA recombinase
MEQKIHIGRLIEAKMKEDGRSAAWLAKKLHCDRSNVYRIYKSHHINTEQLFTISKLLSHNFFTSYSSLL